MTLDLEMSERVVIRNFLSIEHAEIHLSQVTAIIGPQASGKSLVAKTFLFFRNYLFDLLFEAVEAAADKRTFDKEQRERFVELFHIEQGTDRDFSIHYEKNGVKISVQGQKGGKNLQLKTSQNISKLFAKMKIDLHKFKDRNESQNKHHLRSDIYEFFEKYPNKLGNLHDLPQTLLVPAARSFYSTIRSEVFSLLSAQKTLDPVTVQFGRFYEVAKRHFESRRTGRKPGIIKFDEFQLTSKRILKGEFVRRESKDWLKTDWGLIELPNSSSGQQEALPLLMSLSFYPSRFSSDQLLIIEEPEAHLFPLAQKEIIDMAVDVSEKSKCNIFFTSHSPYILACLNNHLVRTGKTRGKRFINAYYMHDGRCDEIFDDEDGLIDFSVLDSVSEDISREFIASINE